MKTIRALSLVIWYAALVQGQVALAQTTSPTLAPAPTCAVNVDEQAIRQIPEQWKDSYNPGDAAKVGALYAEDAYQLTQHFAGGIIHGRRDIQAYAQRGVDARYRVDSIQVLPTACSGHIAYALTPYQSMNAGQKAMGVNLVVLRKIAGHWLIVAHEAAVPDPATAIQSLDASSH